MLRNHSSRFFPRSRSCSSRKLCYYTKPIHFCQHLFSIFFIFSLPFFNLPVCCFIPPFFSFRSFFSHVVRLRFLYTICSLFLHFLPLMNISCFVFSAVFLFSLFVIFSSLFIFSQAKPLSHGQAVTAPLKGRPQSCYTRERF